MRRECCAAITLCLLLCAAAAPGAPTSEERRPFDLRPYVPPWLAGRAPVPERFQIHLFYRAARSLSGAQLGLIANEVVDDMLGMQISGVVNLVGGDGAGVQYSHGMNLVGGDYTGIQLAGLANRVAGDLVGGQYGLVMNAVRGQVTGVQWAWGLNAAGSCRGVCAGFVLNSVFAGGFGIAAGLVNYMGGSFAGLHIGAINIAGWLRQDNPLFYLLDPVGERPRLPSRAEVRLDGLQLGAFNFGPLLRGAQLALAANVAVRVQGLQVALGINRVEGPQPGAGLQHAILGTNRARGPWAGVQLALVSNDADEVSGLQVALGFNSGSDVSGLQQALLFNEAERLSGAQIAALNVVAREMRGAQLAVINVGGTCRGLQVGVVNVCATLRGAQLGAINVAYRERLPFFPGLLVGVGQQAPRRR